jgi:hypothetical protein
MHLPFVTKASVFGILNKLRCAEKKSVSFLPFTEPGARLGDVGTSHFSRSEMITFGRVSGLCLLFEFLT